MEINDGKGLFDKYGMVDELLKKLDVLADAKGAFRCGLIWDMTRMLKCLKNGFQSEDAAHEEKVEALKKHIENLSAAFEKTEGGGNSV